MTETNVMLTDLLPSNAPPLTYANDTSRWLQQTIHDDSQAHGQWCAFTITGEDNMRWLAHILEELCRVASARVFGDDWYYWQQHKRPKKGLRLYGCCIGLIPAKAPDGALHFHGLLRIPRLAVVDRHQWVPVTIFTNQQPTTIHVPPIVQHVFWQHKYCYVRNLHLAHVDGHLHLMQTDEDRTRACDYFAKRCDGEVRGLDQMEWVPWTVRSAIKTRNNDGIYRRQ